MRPEDLKKLLEDVKSGQASVEAAMEKLRHMPFESLGFANVDHHRHIRTGFPEVIYCPGKTTEQVIAIFDALAAKGNNILATRAEEDVYDSLAATARFANLHYDKLAKAIVLEQRPLPRSQTIVPIVTAGTADLSVAREAFVTAQVMGQRAELICDVGVAGLHRLLGHVERLHKANVVVVVAGMEGALASVVGGLVDCPVIAVPTSVGYGSSFKGLAALLTMLNSCASGVSVVNIDNGFAAGVIAAMMNRKIEQAASRYEKGNEGTASDKAGK